MDEAKSQLWYQLYAAAIIELDSRKVIERVDATEAAIHGRLRDVRYDSDPHEERHLIEDAQRTLNPSRQNWRLVKVCSFEQTAAE